MSQSSFDGVLKLERSSAKASQNRNLLFVALLPAAANFPVTFVETTLRPGFLAPAGKTHFFGKSI
jgi:hypothetical protein